MNSTLTTRADRHLLAGMFACAIVILLCGTAGAGAADIAAVTDLPVTVVPDQTAQIHIGKVNARSVEGGIRIAGELIGHRLRQRIFHGHPPRALIIQLLNRAGDVRVADRIALSSHAQHQHGNQAFRFDVILRAVPQPGDTVHLAIDHVSAASTAP